MTEIAGYAKMTVRDIRQLTDRSMDKSADSTETAHGAALPTSGYRWSTQVPSKSTAIIIPASYTHRPAQQVASLRWEIPLQWEGSGVIVVGVGKRRRTRPNENHGLTLIPFACRRP